MNNVKCYAAAFTDNENAEIILYGDIVRERPHNFWTDEIEEGDFIVQNEFLDDLKRLEGVKSLTIRINSFGGDTSAALLIHNKLRELSQKGAALTCIVDGVAMSAGTHIMCACDVVKANPASLIMIHKCWSFMFGCCNADDLRETAKGMDAWDASALAMYERKTGLPRDELERMMSDTTYMTGSEAVEKGFADELIEDAATPDIAASADGHSLFVNGREVRLMPGALVPKDIPVMSIKSKKKTKPSDNIEKGGQKPMANTVEELRNEYPELVAQLEAAAKAKAGNPADDAVKAERKRLEEIDAVAGLFDAETVNAAKYGDTACTAQEMTYRAAQKAVQQGRQFLKDAEDDARESGVQNVEASGHTGEPETGGDTPQAMAAQAKADVAAFQKMKGVR